MCLHRSLVVSGAVLYGESSDLLCSKVGFLLFHLNRRFIFNLFSGKSHKKQVFKYAYHLGCESVLGFCFCFCFIFGLFCFIFV